MSNENLKRKIAALMAKADGTDNANESDAFMSKALELLTKHNIQIAELKDVDDAMGNVFGATWKENCEYKRTLFYAVARLYGCEGIKINRYKRDPIGMLIGRESARIVFGYMWPFILKQVTVQAKALMQDTDITLNNARKLVAGSLSRRIDVILESREQDKQTRENDIIVFNELKAFACQMYPNIKYYSVKTTYSDQSDRLAENVALDVQVNRKNQLKIGN